MAKLTVRDLDLAGKRVLMRVDYNVPMEEKDGQMVINDSTRIKETLPTLELLVKKGAKVILTAHLGRPDGKREPSMSLRPVAAKLSDMLGAPVAFLDDCVGDRVEKYVNSMKNGDIVLLENVRYYSEEESNNPQFAEKLAKLADVYVNDAFGAAHRAHASTAGVAQVLQKRNAPRAAGLLMERELKFLGDELEKPASPFVVILGGAKVSDKIPVINALIDLGVDKILIGGAMAYTFLKAEGFTVGKSLVEDSMMETALEIKKRAEEKGIQFLLPTDHQVVDSYEPIKGQQILAKTIPIEFTNVGHAGMDVGVETVTHFSAALEDARMIVWNGPMGVFEEPPFDEGTVGVARAVAEAADRGATVVVGGGDSVSAVQRAGVADRITHISTGGGATLEFLSGDTLPGVEALTDKN